MALILTGHQRSGTTLMAKLLNAHPQVRMTGEFGNFLAVGAPTRQYVARLLKRWGGICFRDWPLAVSFEGTGSRRRVMLRNNRFIVDYLRRLHQTGAAHVSVDVIERVLAEMLPGARVVGDKYPEYIWDLDRLVNTAGLKVLVMYRDGRDVTSSTLIKARGDWRRMPVFVRRVDSAEKVARRWVEAIELMEAHQDRIFALRYEDLVTELREPLARLSDWLGIDPQGFEVDRISSRSVGKYQRCLTHSEIDTVLKIAGPTLTRLGYT